ncbi:MAG: sulfotransferase domain-containing protein, partial [Colwellia sp.]|nr:sulfotransferase domain-containing protein [Colwellia sp.]
NQRWKGLLTQEQSNRYEKIAAERLTPELEAWLANGS